MTDAGAADRHEVAVFPSRLAAERAVRALLAAGFTADDISVFVYAAITDERTRKPSKVDDSIERGGDIGGELGVAAGGLGGVLAGFGLLSVPGVGPILAVGPLAAAITGVIAGGAFGGFAGSLAGLGVSEAQAIAAEQHMKAGRTVVIVQCGERGPDALAVLSANGAVSPHPTGGGGTPTLP